MFGNPIDVSVPWNTNEMEQVDWPWFSVDLVAFMDKYFRWFSLPLLSQLRCPDVLYPFTWAILLCFYFINGIFLLRKTNQFVDESSSF